ELSESISLAFLSLLDQLTRVERSVYLLRQVFEYEYLEIAEILDKDEPACRQIFSRAKKHIADHRQRYHVSPARKRELLAEFLRASRSGEVGGLIKLLADDVIVWADSGGKRRGAVLRPLHGPLAVAQFAISSRRFLSPDSKAQIEEVNGQPALVVRVQR